MTLVINAGDRLPPVGWQSVERLAHSTATVEQVIDPWTDVTYLGMGTATGDNRNNLYTLATGPVEGKEKMIFMTGTGEAAVFIPMATGRLPFGSILIGTTGSDAHSQNASATGFLVFTASDQFVMLRMINSLWRITDLAGATLSTGT